MDDIKRIRALSWLGMWGRKACVIKNGPRTEYKSLSVWICATKLLNKTNYLLGVDHQCFPMSPPRATWNEHQPCYEPRYGSLTVKYLHLWTRLQTLSETFGQYLRLPYKHKWIADNAVPANMYSTHRHEGCPPGRMDLRGVSLSW